MDCEEIHFSEPIPSFVDDEAIFNDMYRMLASWDDVNMVEDANSTGLTTSEQAIEGPSLIVGYSQDDDDQGSETMAPLVSERCLEEKNHMNLLLLDNDYLDLRDSEFQIHGGDQNWLESAVDSWLYQDTQERNEFQSFLVDPLVTNFGESAPNLDPHENANPNAPGTAQDLGNVVLQDVHPCHREDPPETDQFQTFPDPVNKHSANSAPRLDIEFAQENTPNEARSRTGQSLRSIQDQVETHSVSASHEVERNTKGDRHEHQDAENSLACNICGGYSEFQVVTSCGHVFCQPYCREAWLHVEGKPCPECGCIVPNTDISVSRLYRAPEVDSGSNAECITEHEYAQGFIVHQQGFQPGLVPDQDLDTIGRSVQHETEELDQAVQGLSMEYQPVRQDARNGDQSDPFHEAVAELGPSAMVIDPSTSKQSEQQPSRKRAREMTLVVGHNGVAIRYDGAEERYTAYYRPSYWTEDDSSVFLGEYPTEDEAKDAYNLVALLHDGPKAQILVPFIASRYTDELRKWEGKHHIDLVCELRLRGRGLLKDGAVNYKHVGRRWSGKKKGTRYFSTVSEGPVSSSNAKTGRPKRTFLTTFDNPEQAARYADQVLVKRKGLEAWTNFPLSFYITREDELPLSFLPISNNFRDNLTHKRAKNVAWP